MSKVYSFDHDYLKIRDYLSKLGKDKKVADAIYKDYVVKTFKDHFNLTHDISYDQVLTFVNRNVEAQDWYKQFKLSYSFFVEHYRQLGSLGMTDKEIAIVTSSDEKLNQANRETNEMIKAASNTFKSEIEKANAHLFAKFKSCDPLTIVKFISERHLPLLIQIEASRIIDEDTRRDFTSEQVRLLKMDIIRRIRLGETVDFSYYFK